MALATSVCMILSVPVCPPVNAGPMVTGWLSQYGEAPTVATIAYRQSVGDLPLDLSPFDGFVAVADCGRIGDTGWLSIRGGPLERIAVFDCAGADGTAQWMDGNNIIAEVDFFMARRHRLNQLGGGVEAVLFWEE